MREVDQDRILESCEAARKSLIPEAMRAFISPVQADMQTAIATYISVFEDAAKGQLANNELVYEAAEQVRQHATEPKLSQAVQHCFPTEWRGFVDLVPAAFQFL